MAAALNLLAASGAVRVRTQPNPTLEDAIAPRTLWALERRGYVERIWTGPDAGTVVLSSKGREVCEDRARLLGEFDLGVPGEVAPAP